MSTPTHTARSSTKSAPETGWAYRVASPYRFDLVEERTPSGLAPGELLVELTAGAVCGSDLPVARGAVTPPGGAGQPGRPLHEVVGRVVASEHPDFHPGERVVGWAAQEDALRQHFVTRGDRVSVIRMDVDDVHATVAQSVACLMTVLDRLGPLEGRSVGIIGVGPFGLMAASMMRHHGAGRIVGVDPIDRRADAEGLPFDELITSTARAWVEGLADGDRPDIVLEMVGHQTTTLVDAMNAVASQGTVIAFGVPDDDWYGLPVRSFFRRHGTLITGVTTRHRAMLERAQDYLIAHPEFAQHIVTDVYGLADVELAFAAALHPRAGQRKVVIDTLRG